jgi:pyroglutamyl-peptidase
MKILVTGFGSFSSYSRNPAEPLALSFDEDDTTTLILPVSYAGAKTDLLNAIRFERPRFVLSFGLAASRKHISLEQNARNCLNGARPDNDGVIKTNIKIQEDGKDILRTSFHVTSLQKELEKKGFDVRLSMDAGAYICNEVYYLALAYPVPSLFVHLPLNAMEDKAQGIAFGKTLLALMKEDLVRQNGEQ